MNGVLDVVAAVILGILLIIGVFGVIALWRLFTEDSQ
jgi:hypothetical protein